MAAELSAGAAKLQPRVALPQVCFVAVALRQSCNVSGVSSVYYACLPFPNDSRITFLDGQLYKVGKTTVIVLLRHSAFPVFCRLLEVRQRSGTLLGLLGAALLTSGHTQLLDLASKLDSGVSLDA